MEVEAVPILRVADADAAVRCYERLGFTKQREYRFDPGCPAFVSIACGGARLFLSEHRGDARPDTLVGLTVSDVGAVVAERVQQLADEIERLRALLRGHGIDPQDKTG